MCLRLRSDDKLNEMTVTNKACEKIALVICGNLFKVGAVKFL